jgi:hypothetical protein
MRLVGIHRYHDWLTIVLAPHHCSRGFSHALQTACTCIAIATLLNYYLPSDCGLFLPGSLHCQSVQCECKWSTLSRISSKVHYISASASEVSVYHCLGTVVLRIPSPPIEADNKFRTSYLNSGRWMVLSMSPVIAFLEWMSKFLPRPFS